MGKLISFMENVYFNRVERLRRLMAERGWDAVIITGSDPHSSEYPALRWKQVEWLSGFTGEAGDLVVTADHAGLWTDTRYFIQANAQLAGSGIILHKTRVPEQILIPQWLALHAFPSEKERIVIAVDGLCQRVSAIKELEAAMRMAGRSAAAENDESSYRIVSIPDLLEPLWKDRPAIPSTPVMSLSESTVGERRASKLARLREFTRAKGCDAILLTALDEIAWTLNVRGSDIEYNPLVISYLLVSAEGAQWFVRKEDRAADAGSLEVFADLEAEGIQVLPYDDISIVLAGGYDVPGRLFVDPSTLNHNLYSILEATFTDGRLVEGDSPVGIYKAVKNSVEINGMRECHIRDGVAMEKFLYWLETSVREGGIPVNERSAAIRLGEFRAEIEDYQGDSFETISAYGRSGALPHYVTPQRDAPVLEAHGLYLVDSGGQYLSGTTDITRTVPLGPCTMLEKEDYTLVLKGHIDLAMAVFPKGTAGCQIDALAREPLWRTHRSFGHGTGHGVGFFLGVHEGPQDIRQNFNKVPLEAGMITSDEPGIYREGLHGVRHENLLLCVEDGESEFGSFLAFETLTLCHFDTSAVIIDLLTEDEKAWLNAYNARVFETLSPMLPEEAAEWLEVKCRAIK